MARYRLVIEYLGSAFVGWQHQENGLSVQQALEEAIFRYCGERLRTTAAGRTDSGVHALGQVAHFDLARARDAHQIQQALNFHLRPLPVAVLSVAPVGDDFNARFDAVRRHYRYRIVNRAAPLTVDRGLAWHVAQPLDAGAMHEAARELLGRHDFTTFRASRCQARSPVKTLDGLAVSRHGDEIIVEAEARSFLHHQVRSMVGTLSLVGRGKWTAADVAAALAARDRKALGFNAPPEGLYLLRVDYP